MPDWAAARSFTGDPADLFVAFDELLEALRPPAWQADADCLAWAVGQPDTLAGIWAVTSNRDRRMLRATPAA